MVRAQNRTWTTTVGGELSNHCASPSPRSTTPLPSEDLDGQGVHPVPVELLIDRLTIRPPC